MRATATKEKKRILPGMGTTALSHSNYIHVSAAAATVPQCSLPVGIKNNPNAMMISLHEH